MIPLISLETERALIGSLLNDGELLRLVGLDVEPGDFSDARLGFVYGVLRARWQTGQPHDLITVIDDLCKQDKVIVSPDELRTLSQSDGHPENAREYATIIIRDAQRRRLVEVGTELAQAPNTSADNAGMLAAAQALIDGMSERETQREDGGIDAPLSRLQATRERIAGSDALIGFSTGLSDYDYWSDGIQAGQYHAIGAFTGVGKSWLAVNLANSLLDAGAQVHLYSLEMSARKYMTRLLANRTGINTRMIERGVALREHEQLKLSEAWERLAGLPLRIFEKQSEVDAIGRLIRFYRPDVAIVDYIGKVEPQKGETEYQALKRISRRIAQIANLNQCGIIVFSQLPNDADSGGRGNVRFKGGGDVAADADLDLLLVRDKDEDPSRLTIICKKNRNGPEGKQAYSIDLTCGRIDRL